jgi:uncharacterized protein YndB with AHSA1/START domain
MTPLVLVQVVPHEPQVVFDAFVDSDRLASWWWPHLPDATYDLDATVGGRYRITSAIAGIGVNGQYVALEPPQRIELTWVWEDRQPVEERVEVRLSGIPDGTEVTVRHEVADESSLEGLRQGWTDCLARLAAITG